MLIEKYENTENTERAGVCFQGIDGEIRDVNDHGLIGSRIGIASQSTRVSIRELTGWKTTRR